MLPVRRNGLRPRVPKASLEDADTWSTHSEPIPQDAGVAPTIPDNVQELEAAIAREEAALEERRRAVSLADRQAHLRSLRKERTQLEVTNLQPRPPAVARSRPSRPRRGSDSETDRVNERGNLTDLRRLRELQDLAQKETSNQALFDRSNCG